MADASIRTGFAPFPVGMFHVDNARSLLLSWVAARRSGGTMVLRIEDTDAAQRLREEGLAYYCDCTRGRASEAGVARQYTAPGPFLVVMARLGPEIAGVR
ncbi:hypothetical protein CQJ94_05980 [Glycomyces fuscus]|nr:hypothetical protein CQJ94_05980 [Glycomyces fuscus]